MGINKEKLQEWLIRGQVGQSSKTMCGILLEIPMNKKLSSFGGCEIPYDPGDFQRCLKFVEFCGIELKDLLKIKEELPFWAPFIDNWERMKDLYFKEFPSGKAPNLFKLMQALVDEARVLAGWKRTGKNSWES